MTKLNEAQKAAVRAVFDKHLGTEEELELAAEPDFQPAERGDIFGTPSGLIVRVRRVGRVGWADVQIIGGARDGYSQRMRHGIPADWSRYPR